MKKILLSVVLAVALAAVAGISSTGVSAQEKENPNTWSIAVHLRYVDGTSYDIVLRTGIPMSEVREMLQDCGQSHWTGSAAVVHYHCYPIPE
jgi:hypothetical protein